VDTSRDAAAPPEQPLQRRVRSDADRGLLRSLAAGGAGGNEELTAITGLILIFLFAVIGVTILRIRQLISVHLFVGLLLLGPVLLKMASTGYRFVRYYTRDPIYRHEGPPELPMRLIAPIVVLSTVAVFVSGIVLLFAGPAHRGSLVLIHKVSFIVWVAFVAVHILGHLRDYQTALRAAPRMPAGGSAGGAGRVISIAGAIVAGLVLAIVFIPQFGAWTAHFPPHHHH
jgi:hypothetical protein